MIFGVQYPISPLSAATSALFVLQMATPAYPIPAHTADSVKMGSEATSASVPPVSKATTVRSVKKTRTTVENKSFLFCEKSVYSGRRPFPCYSAIRRGGPKRGTLGYTCRKARLSTFPAASANVFVLVLERPTLFPDSDL